MDMTIVCLRCLLLALLRVPTAFSDCSLELRSDWLCLYTALSHSDAECLLSLETYFCKLAHPVYLPLVHSASRPVQIDIVVKFSNCMSCFCGWNRNDLSCLVLMSFQLNSFGMMQALKQQPFCLT